MKKLSTVTKTSLMLTMTIWFIWKTAVDLRAGEVLINETATACHAEKQIKKKKTATERGRMGGAGKEKVAFGAEKAMLDEGLKGLKRKTVILQWFVSLQFGDHLHF